MAERYVLGELRADEREEFEEHMFGCRECAEDVRDLATLRSGAREVFAQEPAAAPVPEKRPRAGWLDALAMPWLRPAYGLAAAAVLVALTAAAVYQWRPAAGLTEPMVLASVVVRPESRGAQTVIDVSDMSGLVLLEADPPFGADTVAWELRGGPNDRIVWRGTASAPPPGATLKFLIPQSRLEPGDYQLVLENADSSDGDPIKLSHSITIRGG